MQTPISLADSHCHLPLVVSPERNLDAVLESARAKHVEYFLCVAVDLETLPDVLAAAHQRPEVFASVGVHPNAEPPREEPTVARLTTLAARTEVVAIGETGLDYFHSQGDLTWQHDRFRTHVRAAREIRKPLIIHTREAASDVLRILREEKAADVGGVMHCFVDDWDTASAAMDLGFHISFSGIVTFKSASALQEVARKIPAERLLIETDAPWLAPVPFRGKPNEPALVWHTAQFLAELRQETFAALAAATTANFLRLIARDPARRAS